MFSIAPLSHLLLYSQLLSAPPGLNPSQTPPENLVLPRPTYPAAHETSGSAKQQFSKNNPSSSMYFCYSNTGNSSKQH